MCETPNHAIEGNVNEKEPPRQLIIIIIFTTQFIILLLLLLLLFAAAVQNSCNPTPSSKRNTQGQEGQKGVFTTMCTEAVWNLPNDTENSYHENITDQHLTSTTVDVA